ncbi:MAG: hypothetical protein J0J01_05000 [Reyranella sp.]|uniref:ubiquitin-activating E1 FCCH domain-containing protein n=1 Tax=Reyranella sp. TaxID=1929291 RepID=UPI001AC4DC33|nr:ubiquitin-activating E1 FCCH domain-containing protein [Reyranella sp.]MBN9086242.1 hypothetical protein [Reyranella sp.]
MTAIPTIQPSFAAGELSPFLYGRVDLAKFKVGARTLRNFFVHAHGGASNRPGTRFVGEVDDSAKRHRLIPFQFRTLPTGQTYVLVFGDKTMQVAMWNPATASWGFVTEAGKAIQAVTQANPGIVRADGHGYATGDRVALSGLSGMVELNGRTVTVTRIDDDRFSIGLDITGFGAWVANGQAARLFRLATPYASADLALLKYVQSADTMTLTHPNYAARSLTRSGHAAWTLAPLTFAPSTPAPTGLGSTAPGSAASLVVTAINDSSGEESLPSGPAGSSSGGGGAWNWNAVPGCSNYNAYKAKGSVYGFVAQVQSPTWTDANIDPDIANTPPGSRNPFGTGTFTGVTLGAGGSGYTSPTGRLMDNGKQVTTVSFGVSGGAIVSATPAATGQRVGANAFIQITDGAGSGAVLAPVWTDDGSGNGTSYISGVTVVAGGSGYLANAQVHSIYYGVTDYGGYVFTPTVVGGAIVSIAVTPGFGAWDAASQALLSMAATDSAGAGAVVTPTLNVDGGTQNPSCSTYFLQRQVYADTLAQPQTLWFTTVGAFGNMNVSTPTKDSDAITRTLTGRQVNEIRHLVPVGTSMLIMTSGAEWRCWPGPSSNALTPGACFTLPQTAHGSSHVPPIQAGNDVLFVQEKGSRVRALRFDAIQDQYQSFDMSVLSSHLLYDTPGTQQIVEWAFAAEPHQIVWGARSDGVLLGLTYMREHDVYAWHRHTTDGAVESVATVTEPDGHGGYEDALWLIVKRTINGQTRRTLERMVSRTFPTIADAWFVDCGLAYDGDNGDAPHTLTMSGASYASGASVTLTAAGFAPFSDPASLGRQYMLRAGEDSVTVRIAAVTDGLHVTATLAAATPPSLQNTATADWALLATAVDGLDHLEGKTVAILGDGSVVPSQVVSGGRVALDSSYRKVIVGLPYSADLETLNLELPTQASPTAQGQMKKIGQVVVRVKEARGLSVGLDQGAQQEVKQRSAETLGTALQPFSGDWQLSVPSEWNRDGRIFVRQNYPLPATILDLIPEVSLGD